MDKLLKLMFLLFVYFHICIISHQFDLTSQKPCDTCKMFRNQKVPIDW